jgi:hypothetical protein
MCTPWVTQHTSKQYSSSCHTHMSTCLRAQIIVAVKNIDAPMLTRLWQELEYRIDVCRVTSNNSSCQKNFFSFPVAVYNSIKVGPFVFLL